MSHGLVASLSSDNVRVLLYCTHVLHVSGPCSLYICPCLYLIWKNRPVTRKVPPRSYIESEVVHTRTSRPFHLYIVIHFYASNSSPTISEILKLSEKSIYFLQCQKILELNEPLKYYLPNRNNSIYWHGVSSRIFCY